MQRHELAVVCHGDGSTDSNGPGRCPLVWAHLEVTISPTVDPVDARAGSHQAKQLIRRWCSLVFPVVMYGCESWTIKKAECQRIDALELWCWRRLLRVPWTARRSNQSIPKEISPEYSPEGLMLKLKLQYFGHLIRRTNSLEKNSDAGKDWRQEEKGTTEDEMAGRHHRLDWREFEQALGLGERQGRLACCSPWGRKELETTEWLNWYWKSFTKILLYIYPDDSLPACIIYKFEVTELMTLFQFLFPPKWFISTVYLQLFELMSIQNDYLWYKSERTILDISFKLWISVFPRFMKNIKERKNMRNSVNCHFD